MHSGPQDKSDVCVQRDDRTSDHSHSLIKDQTLPSLAVLGCPLLFFVPSFWHSFRNRTGTLWIVFRIINGAPNRDMRLMPLVPI